MHLEKFHIDIFKRHNGHLASLGVAYERYERYCQAVKSFALYKSSLLTRHTVVACNFLFHSEDFYEGYAEGGIIILKGLSPDPGVITGNLHDTELAINLHSYHQASMISGRTIQAQLEQLMRYLMTN